MAAETLPPLIPPKVARIAGWSVMYFLLLAGTFSFPLLPSPDLDPSWRMALGYFYENGLQFGRDVVFNYGPLGFVMGKTFSGYQFWSLIAGQLVLAIIAAGVIIFQARRLSGHARTVFLVFFALWGTAYEDAIHMLVIAMLGFELLRNSHEPWKHRTGLIAVILAAFSLVKFTDLLLCLLVVLVACALAWWRKRGREAGWLGLAFLAAYLAGWRLLGQEVKYLPPYLVESWHISQGWLWAMGLPAPLPPLWKGITILSLLIIYAFVHLGINPDKPRAVGNTILLGGFVYLNWKHGFVRADGHMIGYFYCALLPLAAYPALLDDPDRGRRLHRWVFVGAMLLCLVGIENALPGVVRQSMGIFQDRVWRNVERVMDWKATRQFYRDQLKQARTTAELSRIREIVGKSSVDVLGFEIGVALFNRFNYQPRPVIQSYSTFNPPLDQLNFDHYASDRAPEYALLKVATIDSRLPTMDDPHVLLLLAHRYEFVCSEKGFHLWKRNAGPFSTDTIAPQSLRVETVKIGQPLAVRELSAAPLWLKVDLQPSLLGKIRSFLYKPPQVRICLRDLVGVEREYRMPLPQGRTGFIASPIIDDVVDYMHFAADKLDRRVDTITLRLEREETKYFADTARVEVSALPRANSAARFFNALNEELFHMFKSYPVAHEAHTELSEAKIAGQTVAILHAPSKMVFEMPKGATKISGQYGMLEGTYAKGGNSNGAQFIVYWSNGTDRVDLYQKLIDPMNRPGDRGLQEFSAGLPDLKGGRIYLEVHPGPHNNLGWDWTGWTNIWIR